MNSRLIKIIAIITMTVDHVGLLLFPDSDIFRIIGRIAMPLFCLLIAYGVTKTRNTTKYFLRLFVFAVAVQIFFNLYMHNNIFYFRNWNVFFTLSFGVAAASLVKTSISMAKDKSEAALGRFLGMSASFMGAIAIVMASSLLPVDYGAAGVLLVVLFYLALQHSMVALKITAAASLFVFNTLLHVMYIDAWSIQWWSFLALPFILVFADKKLKISAFEKYAFYVYYPLHFAVIYLMSGFF